MNERLEVGKKEKGRSFNRGSSHPRAHSLDASEPPASESFTSLRRSSNFRSVQVSGGWAVRARLHKYKPKTAIQLNQNVTDYSNCTRGKTVTEKNIRIVGKNTKGALNTSIGIYFYLGGGGGGCTCDMILKLRKVSMRLRTKEQRNKE